MIDPGPVMQSPMILATDCQRQASPMIWKASVKKIEKKTSDIVKFTGLLRNWVIKPNTMKYFSIPDDLYSFKEVWILKFYNFNIPFLEYRDEVSLFSTNVGLFFTTRFQIIKHSKEITKVPKNTSLFVTLQFFLITPIIANKMKNVSE